MSAPSVREIALAEYRAAEATREAERKARAEQEAVERAERLSDLVARVRAETDLGVWFPDAEWVVVSESAGFLGSFGGIVVAPADDPTLYLLVRWKANGIWVAPRAPMGIQTWTVNASRAETLVDLGRILDDRERRSTNEESCE